MSELFFSVFDLLSFSANNVSKGFNFGSYEILGFGEFQEASSQSIAIEVHPSSHWIFLTVVNSALTLNAAVVFFRATNGHRHSSRVEV